MSLTPQEIQSKQFHVRFRGFDVEEVDGFLEQVAENFLMLVEENKTMELEVGALKNDLEKLREEEHSFRNAIISAQSVAEEMKKKSREEADYLLEQAHEEVKKLKDDALKEITELEYQVDRLRGTHGNLQNDLRTVINDYLVMIDNPSPALDSDDEHDLEDEMPKLASSAFADGVVDLSDLYEKVDLPSEHPAAQSLSENADDELSETEDEQTLETELDSPEADAINIEASIPDLDDEIMFTLEDPLDDIKVNENES